MNNYTNYWLPIYQMQYFKYKLQNDYEAIIDLISNIWRNWSLTVDEKRKLIKKIKGEE